MGNLTDWDFRDLDANSGGPQMSRQGSALRVEVVEIEKGKKTGVFFDNDRNLIDTSLNECKCRDFHFVGKTPRKTFIPCKHIYRLAMELGLIDTTDQGYLTKIGVPFREEDDPCRYAMCQAAIRTIGRDYTRWGGWDNQVHVSQDQKIRQARAYEMLDENSHEMSKYTTTLESCTCPDFQARKLPCKHIYFLALQSKIALHVSSDDMLINRKWIFYT